MPVLILEGVQGTGKTALLHEFVLSRNVQLVPFSRTSASSAAEYVSRNIKKTQEDARMLMDWADLNTYYAIDRFAASEYVFGQICERKQDYVWIKQLEQEMAIHNILTVYVFAEYGFICSNIWSRRAAYIADLMVRNLPDAFRLYSEYLESSPLPSMTFYNNHNVNIKVNAENLLVAINDRVHRKWGRVNNGVCV